MRPQPLAEAASAVPKSPGLYAWWAAPDVLSEFPGLANPADTSLRLIYIGISLRPLRQRIVQEHLKRTRRSTLRRALAALLLEAEGFTTMLADRGQVVLVPDDELRLTEWMHRDLSLTWAEAADPRPIEGALIAELAPPLNIDGSASTPQRDRLRQARKAYRASVE